MVLLPTGHAVQTPIGETIMFGGKVRHDFLSEDNLVKSGQSTHCVLLTLLCLSPQSKTMSSQVLWSLVVLPGGHGVQSPVGEATWSLGHGIH